MFLPMGVALLEGGIHLHTIFNNSMLFLVVACAVSGSKLYRLLPAKENTANHITASHSSL